ncbi:PREDICTED: centrosome-associated protein 350-like [Calidris pugnax]|uniref:centrosome-associated protein 350-like n=1 Tax=Calidris pugnax TaxID=198806 RepID=UPI00071CF399|nr:PREDICTED: centrosome-associated protein 350-like [Calidris pugnax]
MDKSFASGESDPLSDVASAWKSLRRAQAVLQRIENKFYHQTWSCAKSQAARRKLWHEKSFDGQRNRDETALNEKKSHEIPPACRKGNCAALSPAWTQTCFLESPAVGSGPPRMTPLSPRGGSRSAPCSPARREAAEGEGTAGTRSPAKSLYRPRWDNFREQAGSRACRVEKEKSPFSLHHPSPCPAGSSPFSAVPYGSWNNAPVPTAVLVPTHHLPSASRARDQKLKELRKKSPQKKLEQLKKRIQEQKQKQQTVSQERLISADGQGPPQRRALKRKVCRVASAPPAPGHRDQRERSSAWRIQTQSQRQPSPKSSPLERAAKDKRVKLPGASAWREGQKLARKLLGPPPTFPNLRSTAGEQTTANIFEPGRRSVSMANSFRGKGKEPVGKSPEFRSCVVPQSKPIERGSNAPTKDMKQILRNLHLQSQCHDDHRHTRLPKDTLKGKVEVLQQYLGIHAPSPGPQAITSSAFSGEKTQSSLMKDRAKPSSSGNCCRGKSASPQRQKGSSSPAQKGSEKENLKYPSRRRLNIKKPHPYSPEIVQEFMYRKKEERRKKSLEEKKSLVQATEMRNKRLQEVYRKQKEAIGKKIRSDQLCRLIRETASAKGSPQCKLEQEHTNGGILESNFKACVDKPPCILLSKDHRSRNQLLYTAQSPKKRAELASPAPLESECCFFSPLKCEDLRGCSPPALQTPPLSFSLPQKDAKSYSQDLSSDLSPYRSKQDRVKALHSLSKELAEKIEVATKRLNAASWVKDSADKTSTETTLDLYNESFSIPEPETSKDEQDRTMTIQMLLDAPDPGVLRHGQGRISLVGITEGPTAPDRQKEMPTPLPGGSSVSKELPWITRGAGQRHLKTEEDLIKALQGFPVNKGSGVDISLLHEKPITSPASPSHRFLARSPQRELTAQRNHYRCETVFKVQNQEEIANRSPRESLRTQDSLRSQPSAALSPGAETHPSFEQDLGEGDPSCTELEEKHRSHLDNLRQTSLLLTHKLKVHQLQQKQQLTVLREKAKLEVQESQRFLSDLLQHNPEECSSSKGCYFSVPRLDHVEQMWRGSQSEGDGAAASNQETRSLKQSALKTERDYSPVDLKTVGERKPLGGRGSYCSGLREEHGKPVHDHETLNLLSPPVNLPHGETCAGDSSGDSSEQTSSNSQVASVLLPHYGGSSTFCCFSLAMVEQCLRGEELRARHQAALLKLRKKALQEKARAELAWLDHQKRCLENLQDGEGASAMAAKQCQILTELKQEQAEIQHLQNIYRAAHQERKLLLKQQREILMMRHSTAQLQEKLHNLAGKPEVIKSESLDSGVQLRNKQSKKYEGFSTEERTLVQYQKRAEESPGLERSLDVQELNAQDHVLLPLEHANSARMDEPISTPITSQGRRHVFLEPMLKEKAFISNPKTDPKDNPVKATEVPVPYEIHQVDGNQCLKHLDHVCHEASDEELNLKAFSEGLASPETSSKSNNFSLRYESAKSDSSLPEFQKVSAVWIDISESFMSDSELELKNGEDTDVSIPEEFVYDNGDVFPNVSKEMLRAIRNGKEMLSTDKPDEHEVTTGDGTKTSSHSQKYPGDVSHHGSTDDLFSFIPSDKANASKTKSAHPSQSDNSAEGMDVPLLDASENDSRSEIFSQEITKQGKDSVASSPCNDTIFISDEDVPPTDEDALSEILSPVDEVLSYGSADLPSSNKKDLSSPSEDLPPPPLGTDAMKNDDPSFSMDDFPSPPEQMTVSETRQCMDEDISLKMDALPPLPDNTVPEEFPLLSGETTDAFSTQDGSISEQSLVKDISSAKEGLLEYQEGEHETALQHLEFLPVSNTISSGQASKSPDFMMKQCKTNLTLPKAEEDSDDPFLSFEIGDRVLVKQTQPGTLMFKGRTCFDSGHWAGVALDKAEGDNAGTYKGVKYFECAQRCGIFVRPGEISHLLGANENASNYTGDEDSDSSCDDKSFKGDCKSSEDDKQGGGLTEQKAEDTNSAGGSEVKENQSRSHLALLSGKGQKLLCSDQCKCNEFLCHNNLTCLGSDKEKTELTQIKQRILAGVLPMKSKTSNTDDVRTSKNICCLVEDQKINKLTDDIASELAKKLLFDTLIALSETAQHKYKSAFEKDMMNYGKGLGQEDNQKQFLLKENSVAIVSEQSAKVSDVSLCDLDMLSIHGCHTVAERIVTKFVDDAVKEYKKIKRKHGSKADKIFHSSSETSPTTFPFLVKILDAGVFGSSEDFDQPNFDQHMLARQTQKQCLYKLDQWHSAPWKKTVEVPLVIPHYSSHVKKLSARAVEELWTPENVYSNFRRISVPKHFECNDLPGNDLETESKRMYNQVICDLTHELLCAEYQVATNPNTFPWMKENLRSYCSGHLCRRTDVNEVKMFVQGEIIKIMNLEKNDLEMKRKFHNMTKYGNCKRDRVDLILIQELHKEEYQWTYYDDDELTVKMRMTEDIFDSLILDTIRVLNKIYRRKACN